MVMLGQHLHRYTKNHAVMTCPLLDLVKKGHELLWTNNCAVAFYEIKLSLQAAPILALPNDDLPYSVMGDAFDFAIGCALLQQDVNRQGRVISYQSRHLKAPE
ncbi:putative reverse transcriptase/retrotransposon-derived protein, RNase H [Plasmopara halstedii]